MVIRRIKRREASTVDLDQQVADYLLSRSAEERAALVTGKYKKQFMELLAEVGELGENGSRKLLLEEPVIFTSYKKGKAQEKEITGILRQRRESTTLNPERTMAFLEAKGLLDSCTEMVRVLDEDAVLGANYSGNISDEEMEALFDKSESYAFYLVEGEGDGEQ
jgi:hypothetical protein